MIRDNNLRAVASLFLSANRRRLAAGMALSLSTVLAGMALLGLSGWFITATAIAGLSLATALAFDVFAPSAGIRFLALARTAARYGERIATHDATLAVLAELRERLFRGWAEARAARSLITRPARLLFRLTVDIDALDTLYLRVMVPVLSAMGAALAATIALGFLSPLLGLSTGLFLLVAGLCVPILAARMARKPARRRAHALEALRARSIDLVRGQTELVMANRAGAQRAAILAADQRLAEADDDLNRIETGSGVALGVAGSALLAALLLASAQLAQTGMIGAPAAAFALLIGLTAMEPFAALRRGAVELGRAMLAVRRIGPRLGVQEQDAGSAAGQPFDGSIRLIHVSAHHTGCDHPALIDLSLNVAPGERVALVGDSGAGKSSLLALLAGELAVANGSIGTSPATLLTQRTELFRDTLSGNLRLAAPDATDADLHNAMDAAGLTDLVDSLPLGMETPLGEGGAGLSAGQARRLALARLLLRDSPVWLLDEPTEGLDGDTARDVIARVFAKAGHRTLIVATHIRREAEGADRILLMKSGRVIRDARKGSAEYQNLLVGLRPD